MDGADCEIVLAAALQGIHGPLAGSGVVIALAQTPLNGAGVLVAGAIRRALEHRHAVASARAPDLASLRVRRSLCTGVGHLHKLL